MKSTVAAPGQRLVEPFEPQTPLGSNTPERVESPLPAYLAPHPHVSPFLSWAVLPSHAFKLLLVPLVLAANWHLLAPYLSPHTPNPFTPIFTLSGRTPASPDHDPRYAKSLWDAVFVLYYVVFWSFVRQSLAHHLLKPLAKYFRLKKSAKVDRFCEQGYALLYFSFSGAWGYHVMSQLPTYWYRTSAFWTGYPNWDMTPHLKCYYLVQSAYWCQQFIVLVLGLEKPRKDYREFVAHHIVTLWLVGWSYLLNLTFIGNAVFMSMDIPDAFLALPKILNYIHWDQSKIVFYVIFIGVWTYFRHYLNFVILWSVWFEFDLAPESSQHWDWASGVFLPAWMRYQVFIPLFLLQLLNLFWYTFMLRILWRAVKTHNATDERSDDEGDDEDDERKKN